MEAAQSPCGAEGGGEERWSERQVGGDSRARRPGGGKNKGGRVVRQLSLGHGPCCSTALIRL